MLVGLLERKFLLQFNLIPELPIYLSCLTVLRPLSPTCVHLHSIPFILSGEMVFPRSFKCVTPRTFTLLYPVPLTQVCNSLPRCPNMASSSWRTPSLRTSDILLNKRKGHQSLIYEPVDWNTCWETVDSKTKWTPTFSTVGSKEDPGFWCYFSFLICMKEYSTSTTVWDNISVHKIFGSYGVPRLFGLFGCTPGPLFSDGVSNKTSSSTSGVQDFSFCLDERERTDSPTQGLVVPEVSFRSEG